MRIQTDVPGQRSSTARLEKVMREEDEVGHLRVAAFYLAEKRGFATGHALEDWLSAEQQLTDRKCAQ